MNNSLFHFLVRDPENARVYTSPYNFRSGIAHSPSNTVFSVVREVLIYPQCFFLFDQICENEHGDSNQIPSPFIDSELQNVLIMLMEQHINTVYCKTKITVLRTLHRIRIIVDIILCQILLKFFRDVSQALRFDHGYVQFKVQHGYIIGQTVSNWKQFVRSLIKQRLQRLFVVQTNDNPTTRVSKSYLSYVIGAVYLVTLLHHGPATIKRRTFLFSV